MSSVEIECQILAVSRGLTLTLTASGKSALLRCKLTEDNAHTLRLLPLLLKSRKVFQFVHRQCSARELSLTFEFFDRPVVNVGHRSRPGLLSRLLGLYPVEIRTVQLFAALLESARSSRY